MPSKKRVISLLYAEGPIKKWRDANPLRASIISRNANLLRRYGITEAQYQQIFTKQDGKCALCKSPSKAARRLDVDHNHRTGIIRGLLCSPCNLALGVIESRWTLLDIYLYAGRDPLRMKREVS